MKTLKKIRILVAAGALAAAPGCQSFLDVNTNPNSPQDVSANLYLAPMLHWFVSSPQFDGRFIGHIAQEWYSTTTNASPPQTWGRMGYDPGSDNGAQQWRDVYWSLGQNLVDMMTKAEAEQRWDLLGVGYILKAWGWQVLTDMHGEIIIKQAIDQSRFAFDYDTQEFAYTEVQRLLGLAITNLQRTDGAVDATYMARTDKIYNGDRTKWLKLAYGMLAINLNHYSNKSTYKPADVIANVDKSFVGNADDALLQYVGSNNEDRNFNGNTRNNLTAYRATRFFVGLMDGTVFGAVDPRMSRMIAPAPDGQYRGLDINVTGFGALTAAQQPMNFFGYVALPATGSQSRYIFDDKSRLPNMTYSQLQFIKAEAAYKMGDKATALTAYRNGISTHIDFVNARNTDANQAATQISATEKAAFLADPRIVPASANQLTLTQIMSQKYIAQWGWGHNELWMDLRRYHYTDLDPAGAAQVFPGFVPPTTLYVNNNGKIVQRIRPRFNSEYVWNIPALEVIGGLALDFHTKPLWITQP
jgi:hypothetical protein